MALEKICSNAETQLIALIEAVNANQLDSNALYVPRSFFTPVPDNNELEEGFSPLVGDVPTAIYYLKSGDVVLVWQGAARLLLNTLRDYVLFRYKPDAKYKLPEHYDLLKRGNTLRTLCLSALAQKNDEKQNSGVNDVYAKWQVRFLEAAEKRRDRERPDILVVEDDAFSCKLLVGFLVRMGRVTIASDAEAARKIYYENAPDVLFLDVELPKMSGHDFATEITQMDPNAYVVMVTANHSTNDIKRAKENSVKGFIIKPYNKQKIIDEFEKYKITRGNEFGDRHE